MPTVLICPQCGKEFSVKPSHADKRKYCSKQCMSIGYKKRMSGESNPNFKDAGRRICQTCGGEFRNYNKKAKYCSIVCRANHPDNIELSRKLGLKNVDKLKEAARGNRVYRQKKIPLIGFSSKKRYVCEVCNAQVWSYRERRTCCKECADILQTKRVTLSCVICGDNYEVPPSVAKLKMKRTCSKTCARKYARKRQLGEKSHRWKGGKTEMAALVRASLPYKMWRESVFERDNYTCQMCGDRGGKLTAHHILLFSEHKEHRYDVGNGITLCWVCHRSIKNKEGGYEDVFFEITGGLS